MPILQRATATVPGSVGNLGPGLDVLGAAVTGAYDAVTAEWSPTPGIRIEDPGDPALPTDPDRHASGIAAREVLQLATAGGARLPQRGITLTVRKGLPLSGGQGGSAASSVAGAAAVNALMGSPLDQAALMEAALCAEGTVAGRHLDNIAPSLLGGICLVRSVDPVDVVSLPVPARMRVVLAHPLQELRTADARAVLPTEIPRDVALRQMANVAAIVAALHAGDLGLLGRSLVDEIAEPARKGLIPGFDAVKAAAMEAGANGASISGAGPTVFAVCDSDVGAQRVSHAMRDAFERQGIEANVRVARVDTHGARVESDPPAGRG